MILDFAMRVSSTQTVTVSAVSTSSIDLSAPGTAGHQAAVGANPHSIGTGRIVPMLVDVTGTFAGGTSVAFEIITATDALLTTSILVLGQSDPYLIAALTAGREPIAVHINPDIGNLQGHNQRFLGARYIVAGGPTSGIVTTGFLLDFQDARIFPASTSS